MTGTGEARARVGFVGLGNMGWPMARHLAAGGFPLTVGDADATVRDRFAAKFDCEPASAPSGFAECEVLVTMLPNDRIVREVLLEWEGGIAPCLPRDAVVLDTSSSNPTGTRELGEQLAELGIAMVDGPVSGGVVGAEAGSLTLMVGSEDESAIEKIEPVLEAVGERVFRTGKLGSGHALKALNNYLAATSYAAATEALHIGEQFGLDPALMFDVVNTSSGRSHVTEVVMSEHIVPGTYETGFALALLAKDVGIAADLASTLGSDAPVLALVSDRWGAAAADAEPGADHSVAHLQWWPDAAATEPRGGEA